MTKKEFLTRMAKDKIDMLQLFLDILKEANLNYCVIGGLAVNAYAEPVASLDLDIVIALVDIKTICKRLRKAFKIEKFEHSINVSHHGSDLRIQLQIDHRYQEFLKRPVTKNVLGYRMKVAALADVLQGKIWAYQDEQRRPSKRQKDLADILRLVESHPQLKKKIPLTLQQNLS